VLQGREFRRETPDSTIETHGVQLAASRPVAIGYRAQIVADELRVRREARQSSGLGMASPPWRLLIAQSNLANLLGWASAKPILYLTDTHYSGCSIVIRFRNDAVVTDGAQTPERPLRALGAKLVQ